jgi:metal-responsive CopG/Arc/MetJ family transcriptional regulator
MRTRASITISLPPEMVKDMERVRKAEHRTRSELVREALRTYFTAGRSYTPTSAELRKIEKGRAAIRSRAYSTLDELSAALASYRRQARPKASRPRS